MIERPTPTLAKDWWVLHSDDGYYGGLRFDTLSQEEVERSNVVRRADTACSADPDLLVAWLELLVATAATGSSIAFIGTWVVEDAYQLIGQAAIDAVHATTLAPEVKSAIMSGVHL